MIITKTNYTPAEQNVPNDQTPNDQTENKSSEDTNLENK